MSDLSVRRFNTENDRRRWWFSSTLCPLIAGTFGPMASMFNLCALIIDWRMVVDTTAASEEVVGVYVQDPSW